MQHIVFYWAITKFLLNLSPHSQSSTNQILHYYSTHGNIFQRCHIKPVSHNITPVLHMRNRFVLRTPPMITSLGFLPTDAHYCVESHKNMICVHTKYSTLLRPIHHGKIFCSASKCINIQGKPVLVDTLNNILLLITFWYKCCFPFTYLSTACCSRLLRLLS